MSFKLQKTISEPIEFQGVGLHNGIKANLCLKPAKINEGIKFKRTDIEDGKNIIDAISKKSKKRLKKQNISRASREKA